MYELKLPLSVSFKDRDGRYGVICLGCNKNIILQYLFNLQRYTLENFQ